MLYFFQLPVCTINSWIIKYKFEIHNFNAQEQHAKPQENSPYFVILSEKMTKSKTAKALLGDFQIFEKHTKL